VTTPAAPRNTATQPALRPDYSPEQLANWRRRHEEFVALARAGNIDVACFGDSITDQWRDEGRASWDRHLAPLRAANFGLSGDRTQQLLWRLENGGLEGLSPRVVVLLIGTNNLAPGLDPQPSLTPRNTVPEIIAGITACVQLLRSRLPAARLLLHGILPRDAAGAPARTEIAAINAALRRLDDNGATIRFLDLGPAFLAPDGSPGPELKPDLLHLSAAGYARWAELLRTPLAELLGHSHTLSDRPSST